MRLGFIVVDELTGTVGYPQLTYLHTGFHVKETRLCFLRVAEVFVTTLSKTVLPLYRKTTSRFRNEHTAREGLAQTCMRAKLAEVEIVEKTETAHVGLHQRRHGQPLRCEVPEINTLHINTLHLVNCIIKDHLWIVFLSDIESFFPVQHTHGRIQD